MSTTAWLAAAALGGVMVPCALGQPQPGGTPPPTTPTPPATPAPAAPSKPDPQTRYHLDDMGRWVPDVAPEPGSDAALIAEARRALAEDRPGAARQLLDRFIEAKDRSDNPLLPQAFLLRGDATSAGGDEYQSLYDYEAVIKQFPGTPEFVTAVERETEIGIRYCNGLYRKVIGLRIMDATDIGEELLIRAQERLPGSRIAERAGIELADYFYREHDLKSAADAYEIFGQNYPNSPYRMKAMQRRVYAEIGQYKGPRYDGSPLLDAQVLVKRFMAMYPSQAQQTGLDEALLTRIDESRAQQLMETAQWYIDRDQPAGARYVLKRILREHAESAAAKRALDIMTERGWMVLNPPPATTPAAPGTPEPMPPGKGDPK